MSTIRDDFTGNSYIFGLDSYSGSQGAVPWTKGTFYGLNALMSPTIGTSQNTVYLSKPFTITTLSQLNVKATVYSEASCDFLKVSVINTSTSAETFVWASSGLIGTYSVSSAAIPSGTYKWKFIYYKDGSVDTAPDKGGVNYIEVVSSEPITGTYYVDPTLSKVTKSKPLNPYIYYGQQIGSSYSLG